MFINKVLVLSPYASTALTACSASSLACEYSLNVVITEVGCCLLQNTKVVETDQIRGQLHKSSTTDPATPQKVKAEQSRYQLSESFTSLSAPQRERTVTNLHNGITHTISEKY